MEDNRDIPGQFTIVLIETLWNVNLHGQASVWLLPGINRNIVECKYITMHTSRMCRAVLIETLWNVNQNSLEISR